MTRRVIESIRRRGQRLGWPTAALAALGCAGAALAAPAASATPPSSGGAAFGPPPGASAQPANLTVSSSLDGMTITAREATPLQTALTVNGTLPASDAGRTVQIELMGVRTGWSWQSASQTQVRSGGSYSVALKTARAGQYAIRALIGPTTAAAATSDSGAAPTIKVIFYRRSIATLYGPGFYGHRTACGTILRKWTVGVANRTLPCGTPVALYYGGQMLVVPVIDRGPYANGANWDLTMATGRALAMDTTATIGAAPLPTHH